jgi:parallel beta-helix repeat protein
MNKVRSVLRGLVCAAVLASALAGCHGVSGAAAKGGESQVCVFFVAADGDDRWSGRRSRPNFRRSAGPFATLARARDAVRQLKAAGGLASPVTVYVRGGTYYLSETIRFTPNDSGTPACPVTYAAYPGEQPVLVGGRRVEGFKQGEGNVVTALLPQVKDGRWFFRQLFVDGRRVIRARTPDYDPSDPYRKGFFYVWRGASGFGQSVGNIHNAGDWMEYAIDVPEDADYALWMLYGANNKPFGLADMGGRTAAVIDSGEPVPLMNLPNTGGWSADAWSRCATVRLAKGTHTFRWQNIKGGGLNIGGYAFCDDPLWKPAASAWPKPAAGKHAIAVPASDFVKSQGRQLSLGGGGSGVATAFRYKPGDIRPEWAQSEGAEIHIFQSEQCRAFKEIVSLAAVDPEQNIATVSGKECVAKLGVGDRYFVENVPDALDSPGEWYLDRKSGELRLWPAGKWTGRSEVVAPVIGRVFELAGDAKTGRAVSHLHFEGFQIRNTDYSPDDGCVGYQTGGDGVVYLGLATDCSVSSCGFRDIGKYAVCVKEGGSNRIVGNEIAGGAEGGVVLLGSAGNTVSDNHIHHCGWVYKHVGGVVLEGPKASSNAVSHNLVHDLPRYGISLKNPGGSNVIEYNELYNLSTETFDTGGIEVTQQDREFRSGSVIRYNRVRVPTGYSSSGGHETRMGWAIYLDSFAGGYAVNNNITCRNSHGGVMLQGGKDNRVWNNILVDSEKTQAYFANFADNTRGNVFERNIVCFSRPDASLFLASNIHESVMRADNNLYWNAGTNVCSVMGVASFAEWQKRGQDVHSLIGDPLFANPAAGDYSLKPGSPALLLGFRPIDTAEIGLRRRR